jgi:hypothetical protein
MSTESGVISKKILLVGFCLVTILGILFFSIAARSNNSSNSSSAAKTDTEAVAIFLNAIVKRDSATSYALFTDKLKQTMSEQIWKTQVDDAFQGYDGKPVFVSAETAATADDDTPSAVKHTYEVTFAKLGDETDVTFIMEITAAKQNNGWKIDNFNSSKQ